MGRSPWNNVPKATGAEQVLSEHSCPPPPPVPCGPPTDRSQCCKWPPPSPQSSRISLDSVPSQQKESLEAGNGDKLLIAPGAILLPCSELL